MGGVKSVKIFLWFSFKKYLYIDYYITNKIE